MSEQITGIELLKDDSDVEQNESRSQRLRRRLGEIGRWLTSTKESSQENRLSSETIGERVFRLFSRIGREQGRWKTGMVTSAAGGDKEMNDYVKDHSMVTPDVGTTTIGILPPRETY